MTPYTTFYQPDDSEDVITIVYEVSSGLPATRESPAEPAEVAIAALEWEDSGKPVMEDEYERYEQELITACEMDAVSRESNR